MPKLPSKTIPLLTSVFLCLVVPAVYSAQGDLSELQKEARIYRNEGWKYQEAGNLMAALSYYQKALLCDPSYAVAYNDAGIILEATGQAEQAKEIYLRAIEADPAYAVSYSNLALLCEGMGDYAQAIVYWMKRATLGSAQDQWAQVARKRLEDIARLYPQAYSRVGEQYKESLKAIGTGEATKERLGFTSSKDLERVSLFPEDAGFSANKLDSKSRALQYLERAKANFERGEYVAALKEATTAEYLDSSNKEISAFVEKVRRVLMQ